MSKDYLARLRKHVLNEMKDEDARIYLFGSWAKGQQRKTSDIDIAIEYRNGKDIDKISKLRESIEESTIPYRVDVINLRQVGQTLVEKIYQEGIVWKD